MSVVVKDLNDMVGESYWIMPTRFSNSNYPKLVKVIKVVNYHEVKLHMVDTNDVRITIEGVKRNKKRIFKRLVYTELEAINDAILFFNGIVGGLISDFTITRYGEIIIDLNKRKNIILLQNKL